MKEIKEMYMRNVRFSLIDGIRFNLKYQDRSGILFYKGINSGGGKYDLRIKGLNIILSHDENISYGYQFKNFKAHCVIY